MASTDALVIRGLLFASWGIITVLFVAGEGSFWLQTAPGVLIVVVLLAALSTGCLVLALVKDPGRGPWRTRERRTNCDDPAQGGYCLECQIAQEPRVKHCKECHVCVQDHDHHCYFVGMCVGGRNFRPFFGFLWSSSLFYVIAAVATVVHYGLTGGQEVSVCQLALVFLAVISCPPMLWLTLNYTVRFVTSPSEPCWERFLRKVVRVPSPDLHDYLLQREKMDVEAARNVGQVPVNPEEAFVEVVPETIRCWSDPGRHQEDLGDGYDVFVISRSWP